MKKIKLVLNYGRTAIGALENETDHYYQITITEMDHIDKKSKFIKVDWKKGDLIKFAKDLVKEVVYD